MASESATDDADVVRGTAQPGPPPPPQGRTLTRPPRGAWARPRRRRRRRLPPRQARHGNTAGARAKRGQASNTQRAAHRARRPRRSDRQAGHSDTTGARAERGQASNTPRAAHRTRRPRRSDRQARHGNTTGAHAKHAQGEGGPVGGNAEEIGRLGLLVSCYREGVPTGRACPPGGHTPPTHCTPRLARGTAEHKMCVIFNYPSSNQICTR